MTNISQLTAIKNCNETCAICYEAFTDDQNNPAVVHDGKHPYHLRCWQAWAKAQEDSGQLYSCPYCRTAVDIRPYRPDATYADICNKTKTLFVTTPPPKDGGF